MIEEREAAASEQSQPESVGNAPSDYKSYKLILFILVLIVGTMSIVRKEDIHKVSSERFIRERVPVLNNFHFITATPPQDVSHKLAKEILMDAKRRGIISITFQAKDLKKTFCKYRNNDTLFCVDLYSNKDEILFYLKEPEKGRF